MFVRFVEDERRENKCQVVAVFHTSEACFGDLFYVRFSQRKMCILTHICISRCWTIFFLSLFTIVVFLQNNNHYSLFDVCFLLRKNYLEFYVCILHMHIHFQYVWFLREWKKTTLVCANVKRVMVNLALYKWILQGRCGNLRLMLTMLST